MILEVSSKHCTRDLVDYMTLSSNNHLIVGEEGLLLLKIADKVILNRFPKSVRVNGFPYDSKVKRDSDFFTELYKYNRLYMNFTSTFRHFMLCRNYFFKRDDGALAVEDMVHIEPNPEIVIEDFFNRVQLEEYFDLRARKADFMAVFNCSGDILYVNSPNDGIVWGKIIPTNKDIMKMDFRNRAINYVVMRHMGQRAVKEPKLRDISKITNVPIYGPIGERTFSHYVLTGNKGHYELEGFQLNFLRNDLFELTVSPMIIEEPTIDDVLRYCQNYTIEEAKYPVQTVKDENTKGSIKLKPIPKDDK